jgi:prevent-host-death family protein
MKRLAITDAQERLDQLVEQVSDGEDIVLMREGTPVATITRYDPSHGRFNRSDDAEADIQFSDNYIG